MRKQKTTTTIEKAGEIKDSVLRLARRGKERVKRVAAIGAVVGAAALVAAGCGDKPGIPTKEEAQTFALGDYNKTYKKAKTPVERYILQYIAPVQIDILDHHGLTGKEKYDWNTYHSFTFGNGCLQNTSYDIAGGHIRGSIGGLFTHGYIKGRVPTSGAEAYVDHRNPDVLTIQSGNENSHDLRFTGAQGTPNHLTPADQQTENVVELTNGCIPAGEVVYEHAELPGGNTSPFVVRTEGDMARPKR